MIKEFRCKFKIEELTLFESTSWIISLRSQQSNFTIIIKKFFQKLM
jgi:hypothetical protein